MTYDEVSLIVPLNNKYVTCIKARLCVPLDSKYTMYIKAGLSVPLKQYVTHIKTTVFVSLKIHLNEVVRFAKQQIRHILFKKPECIFVPLNNKYVTAIKICALYV